MNVELKYKLPINNKEEWKGVNRDKSFEYYSRFNNVEFFQPTTISIHYYIKNSMEIEGIKVVRNYVSKENTDNYTEYIRRH